MDPAPRRLVYLYTGSEDVSKDLELYQKHLGGELVWRFKEMGADVAAVRLGEGPLLLLADHRPAPSVIPIWSVGDLDTVESSMREQGWSGTGTRVEVPDGPVMVLADASGNEIGLMDQVRPNILERR